MTSSSVSGTLHTAGKRERESAREREKAARERAGAGLGRGSHHDVVKEAVYDLKARRHAAVDSYEVAPIHGPTVRPARL
jgi:hypothetical protein